MKQIVDYNELTDKVKKRIDEYIGFDSNELFKHGDAQIFGGAVRDSIAGFDINDIDIICGGETCLKLHSFLESKGYIFQKDLLPKDLGTLYRDIRIISEPHTFTKGDKIIQLIRPAGKPNQTEEEYMEHLNGLISHVDISCCGVSYDGEKVTENYPRAIMHCLCSIFKINDTGMMYNIHRTKMRSHKFIERGWTEFETQREEYKLIRERQMDTLLKDTQ